MLNEFHKDRKYMKLHDYIQCHRGEGGSGWTAPSSYSLGPYLLRHFFEKLPNEENYLSF